MHLYRGEVFNIIRGIMCVTKTKKSNTKNDICIMVAVFTLQLDLAPSYSSKISVVD